MVFIQKMICLKFGTYVINFDEYKSIEIHSITLYVNCDNVRYLDSFKADHIPKQIKKFRANKNLTRNMTNIQLLGISTFWPPRYL